MKTEPKNVMTGKEFAAAMREMNYTQQSLADLWSICPRTIRHWVSGKHAIPGPAIFAMRAMQNGYRPDLDEATVLT